MVRGIHARYFRLRLHLWLPCTIGQSARRPGSAQTRQRRCLWEPFTKMQEISRLCIKQVQGSNLSFLPAKSRSCPSRTAGDNAGRLGRHGAGSRSSRSEFTTTRTLDPAMTPAARIGCRVRTRQGQRNHIVAERPRQVGEDGLTHRTSHADHPGQQPKSVWGQHRSAVSRARSMADPTAMPTSAEASPGPSLRPSPTIATAPWLGRHRSRASRLASGRRPACQSSTPTVAATRAAAQATSPVNNVTQLRDRATLRWSAALQAAACRPTISTARTRAAQAFSLQPMNTTE